MIACIHFLMANLSNLRHILACSSIVTNAVSLLQMLKWFHTVGSSYLDVTDLGYDYSSAITIQQQNNQFEIEAKVSFLALF